MQLAVLASGSSGNCIYVEAAGKHILIDAGISNRAIGKQLASLDIDRNLLDTVLITHEHVDHIRGIDVLSRYNPQVSIYANEGTWKAGNKFLHRVPKGQQKFIETHHSFQLDEVIITPFAISHDASDPVGYKIEAEGYQIVIATDLGVVSQGVYEHCLGADALVIESNHDREMLRTGPYPYFLKQRVAGNKGHLANDITAQLLKRIVNRQTQAVILAHLSEKNNTPEVAQQTSQQVLQAAGLRPNKDFIFEVAKRHEATSRIVLS